MTEYAYTLLRLEQQLESYKRVHQEELDEIRRALVELRNQILLFNPSLVKQNPAPKTEADSFGSASTNGD